jgi:arylsulfatase
MNRKKIAVLLLLLSPVFYCFAQQQKKSAAAPRPNILIILADDMGFSDLSALGSVIKTPALDQLIVNGVSFSNFYNAGRCCPSRAALITGKYPHKVGMGWMTASDLGTPGYTGDLDTSVKLLPKLWAKQITAGTMLVSGI